MTTPFLTAPEVRSFAQHMAQHFGATLKPKATALEMRAAAAFVGLFASIEPDAFLSRWATTLGSTIYLPFAPGDSEDPERLWGQVLTITHECVHVEQHRREGLDYEWTYATQPARRALWEAEAYRTASALWFWRHGWVLDPAEVLAPLASYGLRLHDRAVAERYLRLSLTSIRKGLVLDEASRQAISWLEKNVPGLRDAHLRR